MTQSPNHRLMTYALIIILLIAAAIGWYFYSIEVEKNEAISSGTRSEILKKSHELAELQAKFSRLNEDHKALNNLRQQDIDKLTGERNDISQQLEETKTVNSSLSDELDRTISDGKAIEARLRQEIDKLTQDGEQLSEQLGQEMKTSRSLLVELDRVNSEKTSAETKLQEKVESAILTTAELEAELEKRQAEQAILQNQVESVSGEKSKLLNQLKSVSGEKSKLLNQLESVSGEKSELLNQLEQEQQNKQNIANLKVRLEQELNETRVEISHLKNQMTVIKLTNEVLFSSGSDEIKPEGKKVLSIIADSLNNYPARAISVEGHTDNIPIQNARFSSNWSLSVARSLAAVNYFQHQNQVSPSRLKVVGFGEYHPVADNATAAGRKLNRRIEIKLLPPETKQ